MMPELLKTWRKKKGYSQSQLAEVLGVTTQTISRWERGTRDIPTFLHLALECMEKKGVEIQGKGKKTKKERKVKK